LLPTFSKPHFTLSLLVFFLLAKLAATPKTMGIAIAIVAGLPWMSIG
jgi:hypothetical protein